MKILITPIRNASLAIAAVVSVIYGAVIAIIALSTGEYFALIGLAGIPILFGMVYCMVYTLKAGIIKFLPYSKIRSSGDSYHKSEFEKDTDSLFVTIICFIPMFVFYLLFAWIFYIVKA